MDIEVEIVSSQYSVSLDSPSVLSVSPSLMGATRFTDLIDFNDNNSRRSISTT